jgi:hypothetical protein
MRRAACTRWTVAGEAPNLGSGGVAATGAADLPPGRLAGGRAEHGLGPLAARPRAVVRGPRRVLADRRGRDVGRGVGRAARPHRAAGTTAQGRDGSLTPPRLASAGRWPSVASAGAPRHCLGAAAVNSGSLRYWASPGDGLVGCTARRSLVGRGRQWSRLGKDIRQLRSGATPPWLWCSPAGRPTACRCSSARSRSGSPNDPSSILRGVDSKTLTDCAAPEAYTPR